MITNEDYRMYHAIGAQDTCPCEDCELRRWESWKVIPRVVKSKEQLLKEYYNND